MSPRPSRGDIWLVQFDPVRGHEQTGTRPGLVVSTDLFNQGPANLHVVLPITTTYRRIRWHVEVRPPEGGVRRPSYIQCENVRSLAAERFIARWGAVTHLTMAAVARRLRMLLEL